MTFRINLFDILGQIFGVIAVSKYKVFQIGLRGKGDSLIHPSEEKISLSKGGNLKGTDFDHLNPFQSQKQHSVKIGHQLKSVHSMKVKQK